MQSNAAKAFLLLIFSLERTASFSPSQTCHYSSTHVLLPYTSCRRCLTSTSRLFAYQEKKRLEPKASFLVQDTSSQVNKHSQKTSTTPNMGDVTGDLLSMFQQRDQKHHQYPSRSDLTKNNFATELEETTSNDQSESSVMNKKVFLASSAAILTAGLGFVLHTTGWSLSDLGSAVYTFVSHPQATLQSVVDIVQDMGPAAPIYFGLLYLVAEILAVPATPLTLSAGYLFGVQTGTITVLVAATLAASCAFWIGKTFLRSWVEDVVMKANPKFAKIDQAVGKEGFKLLLLIRLSPIFPFALSNYLYGASSIDFVSYFWGSLLGFTPGTIAYVYTGSFGHELTLGTGAAQHWYVYAGGLAVFTIFIKLLSDVTQRILEAVDSDNDESNASLS